MNPSIQGLRIADFQRGGGGGRLPKVRLRIERYLSDAGHIASALALPRVRHLSMGAVDGWSWSIVS
jgi:hypothetical protein